MKNSWINPVLTVIIASLALGHGLAHAELKGTNATFFSWDDGDDVFRNSNSAIILDGKWHPFFAHLNFDSNPVDPAAVDQSNGQVQCSATDTDDNGLVGTTTPWAGTLRLSVDHIDTGVTPLVNGFRETRCWELAVCDRETDGSGDESGSDDSALPRYRRFAIDVTQTEGSCPTPNFNSQFGYVDPIATNGFITLLDKDIARPCSQSGRCDEKIDTDLYIILDRDCDGFIDDNDGAQVNNDPAEGNLSLIGSGGAGRIPLPVGNNDPDVCFFAEGLKPNFTINPQWTGNIQARITAPVGGSGEKTVNHSIIASPVAGDSGDLPVSYRTALHVTNAFAGNPFIGGAPDNDVDTFTSPLADADDLNNPPSDENGVILPPDTTTDNDGSSAIYTATVTATNNSGSPSMLCGWFDFNQSFSLDNTPNTSTTPNTSPAGALPNGDPASGSAIDTGERSCVVVPTGTNGGSFDLSWTIAQAERDRSGDFFFRFRISSDLDMFDPVLLSHFLGMNSGEVEDYLLQGVSSLPVSIASFESRMTAEGLLVEWTTVSETHNLGFHIWGTSRDGLEQLNGELIAADDSGDMLTPRKYSIVLDHDLAARVGELAITAVDYQGKEDMYGLFEAGARYGEDAEYDNIAWQPVQAAKAERESVRAAAGKRGGADRRHNVIHNGKGSSGKQAAPAGPDYADVRVDAAGLQAISYEELAAAGFDLGGAPLGSIAVTFKGAPVARDIVKVDQNGGSGQGNAAFGPGYEIRFWGDRPELPDALYVDDYRYRIMVDPAAVVSAGQQNASARNTVSTYVRWDRRDDDVHYHLASPLTDPWHAALLRADRKNRHDTQFTLDAGLLSDQPGRVIVVVGGLTDFPEDPDHHVLVEVNGQPVGEAMFDGQSVQRLDLEVPAGILTAGVNTVSVVAPGNSGARFDLFMVDTVELGWPSRIQAGDNRVLVEQAPANAGGLRISGLTGAEPVAYGRTNGALTSLRARQSGGDIEISTLSDSASYWISTPDRVARPNVVATGSNADLLEGRSGDFVIIAHPAFLPISSSEPHPLNDYLVQRRAEGWQPEVFDFTEIQAQFGHGMALPDAVTAFLAAADQRFSYGHVLLIGADSYDYTDNLGLGSISFIPTRYAATNRIPHTPSDALMADLNGDRVADKAVGRWPVRTPGDLSAIVSKTLDWPGVAADRGIVWVTDSEDSLNGSFVEQADRMIELAADAGWSDDAQSRIYWGDVPVAPGQSVATAARERLFDALEQGRALTGFVGHGAPGMWTFQGLLRPNDLKGLYNEGNPTLIGTLTCYTSYFVSPYAESVANRWMNGYRVDAAGSAIPGVPNGAVAIHGAATLSDYSENEIYARAVLEAQLAGMTLGQAIEAGRQAALQQVMPDLVINWTLLGDPTLRLQP